jgi:hypothetical protein
VSKPDNQPAFPSSVAVGHSGDVYQGQFFGMTLRDYFAGRAIPAIIKATSSGRHMAGSIEQMAIDAYDLADAMLTARQKDTPDAE